MNIRARKLWYLVLGVGACAGPLGRQPSAPLPAPATSTVAAQPADVPPAADSGHVSDDSVPPAATVRSEDVEREAVQLFGSEGRRIVADGAGDVGGEAPAPTFDIDVSTYAANRRVLQYLEFFQVDARDRFAIWLSRLSRYEGMIRERLRAKGLPEDLVYLTLIESGLSNSAVSRAHAVGMWQFVSGTARLYGLRVDPWVDERRDPFKATDAAVTYLSDLVQKLGSVYLAAAAYNAGEGRIVRSVRRLPGDPDSLTDQTFFQLVERRFLRRETRDYVPKLIAAALIAKQPERYGFTEIDHVPPLRFDEVRVPDATGLDVLARLADTTTAALVELNPQFTRRITPPGRAVTVRVPRGRGTLVAERYDSLPVTSRLTFVDHYVRRGETLSEIARQYRVSVTTILGANASLRPRRLRIGQRLIIPMSGHVAPRAAIRMSRASVTRSARGAASPAWHRVRAGETATRIARRYGVSLQALLEYNGLKMDSIIKAGQRLRIPTGFARQAQTE